MRTRSALGMAVLVSVSSLSVRANGADEPMDASTRVRIIRKAGQPPVIGRLVLRSPERLTVQTDDGRGVGILFDQVARVQVSDGRSRKRAAGVGALVGLVAAGAVYAVDDGDCSGSECAERFGLMAGSSMVVGALVGSLVAPERWRDVDRVPDVVSLDRSRRFQIGLAPSRGGGVGLAAAIAF